MVREIWLGALLMSAMLNAFANASSPPLNGLVLWLDAADASTLTVDGENRVTRWRDKSAKASAVIVDPVAATALPLWVDSAMNGRPVVRMNGTAAFSGASIRKSKGPATVFVVSRRLPEQAGGKAWQRLFSSRPLLADNDNMLPNFGISVQQTTAYEPKLDFLEIDDVPIGPFAVARNVVGTSEILRGDIAEVLVYDRLLSSQAERENAFDYLAQKWSVAPPAKSTAWTRVGPLGSVPQHTNPNAPLSDQANAGKWVLDTRLSDDFNGTALDAARWHVNNATGTDSLGRKPALFLPTNAVVNNGNLNIYFRKETLPEKYVKLGYKDYSSAMVRTIERGLYGYYEARAKPMNSAGSSAFWLAWTGLPDNATEIDIFEIGGKTKDGAFDKKYNMNAHVWATPQSDEHLSDGSTWVAPWRLASTFHVYGFDWQQDMLRWYVDGVLVREAKNTHFFFPMQIVFDSEAMWQWFGVVDDADLPSTFRIDYVKVWKRGN